MLFKSQNTKREQPTIPKRVETKFVSDPSKKITVSRMFEKINSILDKNMAIISDVGDSLFGALDLTVHDSHHFISDAYYTSMGFAVPGSVGVQAAKPEIRPIVLVGDGAFQMTGMEFSTLVRNKSRAIVFVLNNGGYGTERVMLDGPFNDIQNWAHEKIPAVVGGGLGFKVQTESELDDAISQALAANQPSIINVVIDQNDHTPALQRMFSKLAKKC